MRCCSGKGENPSLSDSESSSITCTSAFSGGMSESRERVTIYCGGPIFLKKLTMLAEGGLGFNMGFGGNLHAN